MALNKSKGNMYPFVSHTWNPIKGICYHDCVYCYMKVYKQIALHVDEKDLTRTDLTGERKFIFLGSSTDMFADDVPRRWIEEVLERCCANEQNRYLFQTKNPRRIYQGKFQFPKHVIIGTTIETNRNDVVRAISKAPSISVRFGYMDNLHKRDGFKTMVTVEPILDFDVSILQKILVWLAPEWVNIGADSKEHNLREPSREKVKELIRLLTNDNVKLFLKPNLKRIYDWKANGEKDKLKWRNGFSCSHHGCLLTKNNPCKVCGRIAGMGNIYYDEGEKEDVRERKSIH